MEGCYKQKEEMFDVGISKQKHYRI